MPKLIFSLMMAVMLLIFASQNMEVVKVRFVFGPPIELPMILIIAGAFIAGFAFALVNTFMRRSAKRSRSQDFDF
ncbi:lipopolysaccharide assembly protein LapA domain-containing protein [Magnetococcales bacterium HHB-1]